MEFHGIKIDITAFTGLITAIGTLVLAWKGKVARNKGDALDKDKKSDPPTA